MTEPPSESRRRGRPPRVTREKIVAAARRLPPAALTMQAVADELGVDRKTIHYHVADRDQLMQLIANENFRTEMERTELDDDAEWPGAIREFAIMVRDASLAVGALVTHFPLDPLELDRAALAPADTALRALLRGGFDITSASHVLRTAGILGTAYAREIEIERRQGRLGQREVVDQALRVQPEDSLSALRLLVTAMPDVGSEAAFDFALDLLVAGAEHLNDAASAADAASAPPRHPGVLPTCKERE